MNAKVLEKDRVLALRKKGLTYREILRLVPVSKSSVSLWLKDSPLTEREKGILKKRKEDDMSRWKLRAGASLRQAKEARNEILFKEAREEFLNNIKNPFFQLGIGLYWAEGAKRSSSFAFTNSDVAMASLMITWIRQYLDPVEDEIRLRVYTHKAFAGEKHELFWSNELQIPASRFHKTIYKSHQGLVVKKRPNYKGCVRIELGKVKYLRKLLFWQQMLIEYYMKQG